QIENRWVSTESPFVDMDWYDTCVDQNARMIMRDQHLPVYVGIDASTKHDSTAIVATTWDHSINKARVVWHRIFQPTPDRPLNFEETVEATVFDLSQRFSIRKVVADPWQMVACIQRLRARGIWIEEFPQSSPRLTESSQNLYELIKSGNIVL